MHISATGTSAELTKEMSALVPSGARMGDEHAGASVDEIESVYRTRLRELRRVATAITGSREVGCDAVQDAFALALVRRQQFRGEGSLEGWVWRIVVHTARDAAATDTRRRVAMLDEELAAARSHGGGERGGEVSSLVAELPERQRLALFLRYYADLDYDWRSTTGRGS